MLQFVLTGRGILSPFAVANLKGKAYGRSRNSQVNSLGCFGTCWSVGGTEAMPALLKTSSGTGKRVH